MKRNASRLQPMNNAWSTHYNQARYYEIWSNDAHLPHRQWEFASQHAQSISFKGRSNCSTQEPITTYLNPLQNSLKSHISSSQHTSFAMLNSTTSRRPSRKTTQALPNLNIGLPGATELKELAKLLFDGFSVRHVEPSMMLASL